MTCDAQHEQERFQVCLDFREQDMTVMGLRVGYVLLDVQSLFCLTPAGTVVHKLVIVAGLRVSALGTWI